MPKSREMGVSETGPGRTCWKSPHVAVGMTIADRPPAQIRTGPTRSSRRLAKAVWEKCGMHAIRVWIESARESG